MCRCRRNRVKILNCLRIRMCPHRSNWTPYCGCYCYFGYSDCPSAFELDEVLLYFQISDSGFSFQHWKAKQDTSSIPNKTHNQISNQGKGGVIHMAFFVISGQSSLACYRSTTLALGISKIKYQQAIIYLTSSWVRNTSITCCHQPNWFFEDIQPFICGVEVRVMIFAVGSCADRHRPRPVLRVAGPNHKSEPGQGGVDPDGERTPPPSPFLLWKLDCLFFRHCVNKN